MHGIGTNSTNPKNWRFLFALKQRKNTPEYIKEHKEEIGEELADVMIYLLFLADELGLDIKKIVEDKLKKSDQKYPVEKSKGNDKKYTEL